MDMSRSSDAWDSLQVALGGGRPSSFFFFFFFRLVPQRGQGARGRHSAMDGRPIGSLGRPKPGNLARISN